mmetsp:Transcript_22901/g.36796  ORF Transcript_22901/g.36796 Transcript_22901/m.36796 type:complete len:322 (+) Transcript_22901:1849-2814(+)
MRTNRFRGICKDRPGCALLAAVRKLMLLIFDSTDETPVGFAPALGSRHFPAIPLLEKVLMLKIRVGREMPPELALYSLGNDGVTTRTPPSSAEAGASENTCIDFASKLSVLNSTPGASAASACPERCISTSTKCKMLSTEEQLILFLVSDAVGWFVGDVGEVGGVLAGGRVGATEGGEEEEEEALDDMSRRLESVLAVFAPLLVLTSSAGVAASINALVVLARRSMLWEDESTASDFVSVTMICVPCSPATDILSAELSESSSFMLTVDHISLARDPIVVAVWEEEVRRCIRRVNSPTEEVPTTPFAAASRTLSLQSEIPI